MYKEAIESYYSRTNVQRAILGVSENRELIPVLSTGSFGSRPNAVYYEKDVEQMVKGGAIDFHCSVERWKDPLKLKTGMRKEDQDALRIGWDLIIDIDCKKTLEEAKTACIILLDRIEELNIRNYGVKFSGNRGFHIVVPFEAFPTEVMGMGEIAKNYPGLPRKMIQYLADSTFDTMYEAFGENPNDVLEIDHGVISPRHLFRAPYALNRKTWLASIPLDKKEIKNFDPQSAQPSKVKVKKKFLKEVDENEAIELLRSAAYWTSKREKATEKKTIAFEVPKDAIPVKFFPSCIQKIMEGLDDGRKRSVFILVSFLHRIGWERQDVWTFLVDWNKKNKPPLADNLLKSSFTSQYTGEGPKMSPNCSNPGYYGGFGDSTCDHRNPVSYTLGRVKAIKRKKPRRRRAKTKKETKQEKGVGE
jgi:DNA primase|nr:hypothetical protein [Candidatus Undinarchaeales archaeon ERR594346 U_76725]|tara:strand:+ start:50555 stop:51808 length:1254 start_codon:yes stop_codon:yes gene_type:complete